MSDGPAAPPGLTAADWAVLVKDSKRITDSKFLKIYQLLEHMREHPQVQPAFEAIRPRLAELRPPRRISVSRLFFAPVEDLLDDTESYQRRLNRISRAILVPSWKALVDRLPDGLVKDIQSQLSRTDSRDGRALALVGERLWVEGAEALTALLKEARGNLKLQVALFGRDEDVLAQLDTVCEVIRIGPRIEELKLSLPAKPTGDLAEHHVDLIKTALSQLGEENPRLTSPALLVLTSRMKRPGDLLKMLQQVRLGGTPQEKEDLTKELSSIVVGNLIRQTAGIERANEHGGADGLAAAAERLTEGLNSVNETVLNLKDREMTRKVDNARSEIADFVIRTIVDNVDTAMIGTLFESGEVPSSDANVKKAEQLALALRRSAKLAPHLGIKRQVDAQITEVRRRVELEMEGLLRDSDTPGGPQEQRQLFNSLRMIEILAGSDEAERLFREWQLISE